jgi:hypothetical protein
MSTQHSLEVTNISKSYSGRNVVSVVGNINANEKIIIHEGGSVTGDMDAPKVIL